MHDIDERLRELLFQILYFFGLSFLRFHQIDGLHVLSLKRARYLSRTFQNQMDFAMRHGKQFLIMHLRYLMVTRNRFLAEAGLKTLK